MRHVFSQLIGQEDQFGVHARSSYLSSVKMRFVFLICISFASISLSEGADANLYSVTDANKRISMAVLKRSLEGSGPVCCCRNKTKIYHTPHDQGNGGSDQHDAATTMYNPDTELAKNIGDSNPSGTEYKNENPAEPSSSTYGSAQNIGNAYSVISDATNAIESGGKCNIVRGEDLPPSTKTDHEAPSNGRILNKGELDSIQKALGIPGYAYFKQRLDSIPDAWCPGANTDPVRADIGVYLVMSTAMKLKMMPASTWLGCDDSDDLNKNLADENTCEQKAGRVYGALKIAGRQGDGAAVHAILSGHGGNTFGLCDEALAILWGVNEHQQLHDTLCHPDMHQEHAPFLDADSVFHGTHITSLSDGLSYSDYWSVRIDGTLGGFNNEGSWPERRWFPSALNYPKLFPEAF